MAELDLRMALLEALARVGDDGLTGSDLALIVEADRTLVDQELERLYAAGDVERTDGGLRLWRLGVGVPMRVRRDATPVRVPRRVRELLAHLRDEGWRTVAQLEAELERSRWELYRDLRQLVDAQLVEWRPRGREREFGARAVFAGPAWTLVGALKALARAEAELAQAEGLVEDARRRARDAAEIVRAIRQLISAANLSCAAEG